LISARSVSTTGCDKKAWVSPLRWQWESEKRAKKRKKRMNRDLIIIESRQTEAK
jgi:hypothetical protein